MFLLVTGASGAGKSTVRRLVARDLSPEIECVELHHVIGVPPFPSVAWRQQATEAAVRRAIELQTERRHLLLCGDPVAAGELLAAPSAVELDGVAVCLLDLSPQAQASRLDARGDDPSLLADHHAFAEWMRGHARDPGHMTHVLSAHGWEAMRWQRWAGIDPAEGNWGMEIIDTSKLAPHEVAAEVVGWCHRALHRQAPVMHAADTASDR